MAEGTGRRLRYIGPFESVTISATGDTVARNHEVRVADDALADSLLEQTDNWREWGKAGDPGDGTPAPEAAAPPADTPAETPKEGS